MSLSKRDIELMQLGFQCFESPPMVNFEKLASLAGLKNAHSARNCYHGAKRKFLSAGATATTVASLATSSTTTPNSSPSAPASKKRKTSAKTTTSKPTKGKGGKGSTNAAKSRSAANHDDDAFDADDDAEDDEEPGLELDVKNVLALISEEDTASAADMQLKFDQDAHTVKQGAAASTLDIADNHLAAKNNAGDTDVKPKEVQPTTVVKPEEQNEEDVKANDLLRKAVRMAMNATLGNEVVAVEKDEGLVSSGKTMDLSGQSGAKAVETGDMAVAAKTVSGLMGGQVSEKADEV